MSKVWLLKVVLPVRYGRTFTGLCLLALLLPLFYIGAAGAEEHRPPALFFSFILAYIVPVFSFITAKAQENLRALRPILDISDEQFDRFHTLLDSASAQVILACLCGGALAGCAHIGFIHGSVTAALDDMVSSVPGALTAWGTLLVWVVMTTVITMLIQQAVVFSRVGGEFARVSLLDRRRLAPFARVSIISSLAIIGALALFPLINLEGGLNLAESVPGAVAILGPLIVIFIIPVWPLHQRLVKLKSREMLRVFERIEASLDSRGGDDFAAGDIERMLPLLNYRREIAQMRTWPFDVGNIATFAFYLVIPPLTWAGAALIENLVNYLL